MPELPRSQVRRHASKETRRRQLIEATIECVAKYGLSDMTLAHISQKAGLSQGIVNLHFKTKEILLTETLRFLRNEYEQTWQSALSGSDKAPARQLAALLRADYAPAVTSRKKLAVWFAFWGEVKVRPTYREISEEQVGVYVRNLSEILARLAAEGKYTDIDIPAVAEGIMAMADGLWLKMLISPRTLKRQQAEKVMMQYLAKLFPHHQDIFLQG